MTNQTIKQHRRLFNGNKRRKMAVDTHHEAIVRIARWFWSAVFIVYAILAIVIVIAVAS